MRKTTKSWIADLLRWQHIETYLNVLKSINKFNSKIAIIFEQNKFKMQIETMNISIT